MDKTFDKFILEAKERGLCKVYSEKVDDALSKRQILDIALDANGLKYVAQSIAQGWGLTAEYIQSEFTPFLAGRYIHHGTAYSSCLFCRNQQAEITTTAALVIEGNRIHTDRICEVYVVNSEVEITGNGKCHVYLYNSTIKNTDTFKGVIMEDNHYE